MSYLEIALIFALLVAIILAVLAFTAASEGHNQSYLVGKSDGFEEGYNFAKMEKQHDTP